MTFEIIQSLQKIGTKSIDSYGFVLKSLY